MKTLQLSALTIAAIAAIALFVTSPILEGAYDNNLVDRTITATCNHDHGLDFAHRWLCRWDYRQRRESMYFDCGFDKWTKYHDFNREDFYCRYFAAQFLKDRANVAEKEAKR